MLDIINRRRKAPLQFARAGFTLTEVIVVLVVLALLAAVIIPSMIAFIRHGQQMNRTNIARTLYVAMQNQLSRAVVEGNLRLLLTEDYYEKDVNDNDVRDDDGNPKWVSGMITDYLVSGKLNVNFPTDDNANRNNVFFISKPANYVVGTNKLIDQFYQLLDEVILNKSILDGAILMEYNVRTGVIMSIFYGDDITVNTQNRFGYGATANNYEDVTGARGMGTAGYTQAYQRWQGYYGVTYTGVAPPLPIDDIVRIFDGMNYTYPEVGGTSGIGLDIGEGTRKTNILFAEYFIQGGINNTHVLEIYDENAPENTLITATNPATGLDANFDTALARQNPIYRSPDSNVIVEQYGINVVGLFDRYIWVLDYIEGDTILNQDNNIFEKYKSTALDSANPVNLRARLVHPNRSPINSLMHANSHFYDKWPNGSYEITSVRHLNNVRYVPNGDYLQTTHIDVGTIAYDRGGSTYNPNYNFKPIESIGENGSYTAINGMRSQWRIENLRIVTNDTLHPSYQNKNIGLFSTVKGNIIGLSLFKAEIRATDADNVGAIAGRLDNGKIIRSNSYANVIGGGINTGGLVGEIINVGELSSSFNAGFYNTHENTKTYYVDTGAFNGYGSVTATSGNIGGLVGRNVGMIIQCYNNARVNIFDVDLTAELTSTDPTETLPTPTSASLGGITGENLSSTSITNSYATNFVGVYDAAGVVSGGIAGSGSGTITNSFYIENNIDGPNSISKEDLRSLTSGLNFGTTQIKFEIEPDYHARYEEGKNLYTEYPYPILGNNRPFEDIAKDFADPDDNINPWGWEDIEAGEIPVSLVYYELYSNDQWGFQYPESIQNPPRTLLPEGSTLATVKNDGYSIELPYTNSGYTLSIGDGHASEIQEIYNILIIPGSNPDLIVTEQGNATDLQWAGTTFSSLEGEMYRIYIPNHVLERVASKLANLQPGATASTSIKLFRGINNLSESNNVFSTTINPFFAPSNLRLIRSPRHIHNIGKAFNGLSGNYTQQLNMDFGNYFMELTGDPRVLDSSRLVFTRAVVQGTFTGTYTGSSAVGTIAVPSRYISNLTINGSNTTDNVGLFERNQGTIQRVYIRDSNIIGGLNVGAIAGVNEPGNGGLIRRCNLANITVRGVRQVGGVAGLNTGSIGDTSGISTAGLSYTVVNAGNSSINLTNVTVEGLTSTTAADHIGGIAGFNNGGTITDCTLVRSNIGTPNSTYVGGVTGRNTGWITRSFIGQSTDGNPTENNIRGTQYVGGITGCVGNGSGAVGTGLIEVCYVSNTRVGSATSATNIGGIAGYLNVSTADANSGIRNVFFNYGNAGPQFNNYPASGTPITGASASTGGLVGFLATGNLTNSYSAAFFGTTATTSRNLLVGTSSPVTLPESLLYLSTPIFNNVNFNNNSTSIPAGGTQRTVSALNSNITTATTGATMFLLNGSATTAASTWQLGSSANNGTITAPPSYTYPRLQAFGTEPQRWPFVYTTADTSRIGYYEIYENDNPKITTGAVGSRNYGIWYSNSDTLDYNQKVLEDGYFVMVESGSNLTSGNNSFTYQNLAGTVTNTHRQFASSATRLGGLQAIILNLEAMTDFVITNGNGISIIRVGASNAGAGFDYLDVYVNPLFAKSIFTAAEVRRMAASHGYNVGTGTAPITSATDRAEVNNYFVNVHEHLIRTPRHINNIGVDLTTLNGRFNQEIDIDFSGLNTVSGYWQNVELNAPTLANRRNININRSVVSNLSIAPRDGSIGRDNDLVFTGRYSGWSPSWEFAEDNRIRTIKNITIPNNPPNATQRSGNIGIFPSIGPGGIVENLILFNNTINGTTGNVGGLTAVNNGTIRNVSVINNNIRATDIAGYSGGVAARNTGVINSIQYISNNSATTPPVNAINPDNTGGIVATNQTDPESPLVDNGTISNVLFLAPAPGENPITASNSGTVSNSYYLSGSISQNNRPGVPVDITTVNNYNYGYIAQGGGQPLTSQEISNWLNVSGWTGPWTSPVASTNVLTNNNYPYPYMFLIQPSTLIPPSAWPVATVPASQIVYFERYSTGAPMGFNPGASIALPADFPSLRDDAPISATGYCALVPGPGWYTVRQFPTGMNTLIQATNANSGSEYYVILPASITSGTANAVEIYINDLPITDVNSRYVNTLFAKGLFTNNTTTEFTIRTPQQMQRISAFNARPAGMTGVTFTQDRDMDFRTDVITAQAGVVMSSVVTGNFLAKYDGGGYMISNIAINSADLNTGLFSQNSGIIERLMLVFNNTQISATAGSENVGTITGNNAVSGVISDITIIGTQVNTSDVAIPPVTGPATTNIGGITGENLGAIERVMYLAPAPTDSVTAYPIIGIDDTTLSYNEVYYLSATDDTSEAGISSPDGFVTAQISGYDYTSLNQSLTSPDAMGVDTDWLNDITNIDWSTDGWELINTPIDYLEYPYQNIFKTPPSLPTSWPVVSENPLPLLTTASLTVDDPLQDDEPDDNKDNIDSEEDLIEDDTEDNDNSNQTNNETDENTENSKTEDSEETDLVTSSVTDESESPSFNVSGIDESSYTEDLALVVSVITLFGGYGFTRTRPFRKFMSKRNARAVRKINEYNDKKRRKP